MYNYIEADNDYYAGFGRPRRSYIYENKIIMSVNLLESFIIYIKMK